ncbi:MAG: putative DNA binding domain-containing protein [Candidatus Margulisbacteria bacterium]|nr:putative DNA binding domain-containing protein [Candidatus Margulisiibacteriota bacterium]
MNWDEIITLLEQGEGQSVEFEKFIPKPDDIARDLVAFANSDGGKIVYGLDDKNKHLTGVDIGDDFNDVLEEIAAKKCSPKISLESIVVSKAEKKIVIITVPEGDEKPYKTDEIVYIRDGALSRPAREEEVQQITTPWSGKGLNKRQKRALQLIQEHGTITNREFRQAFDVSHKTAHIELTMLVEKGMLISQGLGRSTRYIMPAQVEG